MMVVEAVEDLIQGQIAGLVSIRSLLVLVGVDCTDGTIWKKEQVFLATRTCTGTLFQGLTGGSLGLSCISGQ